MSAERPLHILSLGPKRYVLLRPRVGGGWDVVGGTEHALGGGVIDPPTMVGRDAERRHFWTYPVAAYAISLAEGSRNLFSASWDGPGAAAFPVLRRLQAATPETLQRVPPALGAHPFSPLVQAQPDRAYAPGAEAPLALDPGTDLAEWRDLDWRVRDGRPSDVPLLPLVDFAERWSHPVPPDERAGLVAEPRLIRRVGRGGALIDARLAGSTAPASELQVVYNDGDAARFVADEAKRLGATVFARRYGVPERTARGITGGRTPSKTTVRRVLRSLRVVTEETRRCALDGCDAPVWRPNGRYCIPAHADRAYRLRRKARDQEEAP
jgi:hypothetical protein